MAGIPPTIGFFAKLTVVEALVQAHMSWLACFAVVFSIIGAFYYIRVVRVIYFEEPTDRSAIHVCKDANVALSLNAFALLILGIFPGVIISLCYSAF